LVVDTIRSGMHPSDKQKVMERWDSETSGVNVLVLNSAVSAAGLNCQRNCHVGIAAGFTWNVATENQILGRLFRIGQRSSVRFYCPTVKGTVNEWLQERRLRKVRDTQHVATTPIGIPSPVYTSWCSCHLPILSYTNWCSSPSSASSLTGNSGCMKWSIGFGSLPQSLPAR
jgi:hypothetical protein